MSSLLSIIDLGNLGMASLRPMIPPAVFILLGTRRHFGPAGSIWRPGPRPTQAGGATRTPALSLISIAFRTRRRRRRRLLARPAAGSGGAGAALTMTLRLPALLYTCCRALGCGPHPHPRALPEIFCLV